MIHFFQVESVQEVFVLDDVFPVSAGVIQDVLKISFHNITRTLLKSNRHVCTLIDPTEGLSHFGVNVILHRRSQWSRKHSLNQNLHFLSDKWGWNILPRSIRALKKSDMIYDCDLKWQYILTDCSNFLTKHFIQRINSYVQTYSLWCGHHWRRWRKNLEYLHSTRNFEKRKNLLFWRKKTENIISKNNSSSKHNGAKVALEIIIFCDFYLTMENFHLKVFNLKKCSVVSEMCYCFEIFVKKKLYWQWTPLWIVPQKSFAAIFQRKKK